MAPPAADLTLFPRLSDTEPHDRHRESPDRPRGRGDRWHDDAGERWRLLSNVRLIAW